MLSLDNHEPISAPLDAREDHTLTQQTEAFTHRQRADANTVHIGARGRGMADSEQDDHDIVLSLNPPENLTSFPSPHFFWPPSDSLGRGRDEYDVDRSEFSAMYS
jgi:hypothetical protein